MIFDSSKIKGLIREKDLTQEIVAKEVTPNSLYLVNNFVNPLVSKTSELSFWFNISIYKSSVSL